MNLPRYRLSTPADAGAVLSLFRAAFPHVPFAPEWWDWFAGGPTRTYVVQFDGAGVVGGAFSVIDYPFLQVGSRRLRAALACNLCLLPEFQRRHRGGNESHFAPFIEHVQWSERSRGTEVLLVVPNANSAGRLRAQGWQVMDQLRIWTRPGSPASATADDPAATGIRIHCLGDSTFFSWRLARPGAHYSKWQAASGGTAVLKQYDDPVTGLRKLHVMSLDAENDDQVLGILEGAATWDSNRDSVDFWLAGRSPLAAIAVRAGYCPSASRVLLGWFADGPPDSIGTADIRFGYLDCDVY